MITTDYRAHKNRPLFKGFLGNGTAQDGEWLAQLCSREAPIPADILSPSQLRQCAINLAKSHRETTRQSQDRLSGRCEENARVIEETYRLLGQTSGESHDIPPAGLWLLNNFNFIQDQLRKVRCCLSGKYSKELPQLSEGPHAGLPRVYGLALELITHLDGKLDHNNLHEFLDSYQSVTPLALNEICAIQDMLRLALIENLRRISIRIALRRFGRSPDEKWFDRIVTEHRDQSAEQKSMRNTIAGLNALESLQGVQFVERESSLERILRLDPAGIYEHVNPISRAHYRRVVETLAQHSSHSELDVARMAIKLANQKGTVRSAAADRNSPRLGENRHNPRVDMSADAIQSHVGYYLLDKGRKELEEKISYRPDWKEKLVRMAARAPFGSYIGAIVFVWLLTVVGAVVVGLWLGAGQTVNTAGLLLLLTLFAGVAMQFAVQLVNWICTLVVPPRPVMRMDFSSGIPPEHRTLVAVPAMLTSEDAVRDLMRQLEVRYLANQDDNLFFALITDFPDAESESMPADRQLLLLARREFRRLKDRYYRNRQCLFFFLHRPRKWNGQECIWMGEERKRGKLATLNRLLRTGINDAFSVTLGDLKQLRSVRYVITLDSDTRLPWNAGRELASCMAHPLNRPRIDPQTGCVTGGYAILQPRVSVTISEANRSRFSRLLAGDAGIDPYTKYASNVYHDLFAQGSYIGKGIYDVAAFETALEERFPENRVLSHDLIEGCFASCGYVGDVELFEGVPSRLLADNNRRHRWIRGDWQIASWLMSKVPTALGKAGNPLSGLSRWKIFENLRLSLTPLLVLSFLMLGWILAPAFAGFWTLLTLTMISGPALINSLAGFFRNRRAPRPLWRADQAHGPPCR